MLMWTDWTNWDGNLTSNEMKHLSHKKADKGGRCKVKTLELSSRVFTCPNPSFWTLLSTQMEILENNVERLATSRAGWARKAVCPQNCPHFLFQNTKPDKRSFLALTVPLLLGSSGHLAPRADPWNSLSWRQQTGMLFFWSATAVIKDSHFVQGLWTVSLGSRKCWHNCNGHHRARHLQNKLSSRSLSLLEDKA